MRLVTAAVVWTVALLAAPGDLRAGEVPPVCRGFGGI